MEIFSVHINFLTALTIFTVLSGVIVLINKLFLAKKRVARLGEDAVDPLVIEYSKSFFPILLVVLILRSFIFEGYRIPSGSLEPSLLIGDVILVNKYTYGLRLPVGNGVIYPIGEPKIGDIVVFEWPPNRNVYMIKRVMGVPGDVVEQKGDIFYINGKAAEHKFVEHALDGSSGMTVEKRVESLPDMEHEIYVIPRAKTPKFKITVPKGHYLMVGDNRDLSQDSRFWGLMPYENIVGKAQAVVISWNSDFFKLRFNRTFSKVN